MFTTGQEFGERAQYCGFIGRNCAAVALAWSSNP